MKRPVSLYFLIAIFLFLAIGAIYGGGQLILDPSGKMLQLPAFFIEGPNSPFSDYLIPGIILFVFNGLLPLFAAYALLAKPKITLLAKINPFKKYHWAWTLSGVVGVSILIWIVTEIYMTMYFPPLQLPFLGLGLIIILLTLMPKMRSYYKN